MLAWFTFGIAVVALWLVLALWVALVWIASKAKPYVGLLSMFQPAPAVESVADANGAGDE